MKLPSASEALVAPVLGVAVTLSVHLLPPGLGPVQEEQLSQSRQRPPLQEQESPWQRCSQWRPGELRAAVARRTPTVLHWAKGVSVFVLSLPPEPV